MKFSALMIAALLSYTGAVMAADNAVNNAPSSAKAEAKNDGKAALQSSKRVAKHHKKKQAGATTQGAVVRKAVKG